MKLKNALRIVVFLVCNSLILSCVSQDLITLKNGDELKGKVLEVGSSTVKYSSDSLSPARTLSKDDIFSIDYQNGTKDLFNTEKAQTPTQAPPPVNKSNQVNQVKASPKKEEAGGDKTDYMHLGKKKIVSGAVMTGVGIPTLITGAALTVVGIALNQDTYDPYSGTTVYGDPTLLIVGSVLLAAGTALTIAGPVVLAKGIHYRKLANKSTATLEFLPKSKINFDRYIHVMNQKSLGGIAINF